MENTMYTYDSLSNSYNRNYVPTNRFQISSSVRLPSSEIDFRTGMLKPDHCRRRTQAARLELEWNLREEEKIQKALFEETAKKGVQVSMRTFILVVVSFVIFLCMSLIFQTAKIAELNREINLTQITIEDYKESNEELSDAIKENSAETVIMTAARDRLGMVRRSEKEAYHMIAPETRPAMQQTVQTTASNTQTPVAANNYQITVAYSNRN